MKKTVFGSEKLAALLEQVAPLRSLDIGARGVPCKTMLSLAWAVEAIGFEPDAEECERLNAFYAEPKNNPFQQTRLFPVALGREARGRLLYLTKHRGTSSLLPPMEGKAAEFVRSDYGEVEKTVEVDTVPLDRFLENNNLRDIAHMKVDVEGLELEILQTAEKLLSSSLLAVDSEISFMPARHGQPLYGELEGYLRSFDFEPLGFTEQHSWRRLTKSKFPKNVKGPIPFSRGQLVHGNMLFMKTPDAVFAQVPEQIIQAAFIAINYGYLDHALFLLKNENVAGHLKQAGIADLTAELRKVSLTQYRQYRRKK
jgi:FkbM family methyltransferase